MEYGKGGYAIVDCTFLTEANLGDLLSGTPVIISYDHFKQLFDAIGSGKPAAYIAIKNDMGTVLYISCQQMRAGGVSIQESATGEFMMHTEISNNPAVVHATFIVNHVFATDVCTISFANIIVTT